MQPPKENSRLNYRLGVIIWLRLLLLLVLYKTVSVTFSGWMLPRTESFAMHNRFKSWSWVLISLSWLLLFLTFLSQHWMMIMIQVSTQLNTHETNPFLVRLMRVHQRTFDLICHLSHHIIIAMSNLSVLMSYHAIPCNSLSVFVQFSYLSVRWYARGTK